MKPRALSVCGLTLLLAVTLGCAESDPLARFERELAPYSEYSVVLQDMKEGGNFTDSFYHQYRIVQGVREAGSDETTFQDRLEDWTPVSEKPYRQLEPYLGMTVLSKGEDGVVERTQEPAGFQYVGNPRYGQWRNDSSGSSFWEFYGKYALMSHLFDTFRRPVYRGEWSDYSSSRQRRQPYFGRDRRFGTEGSYTKTTHRGFFERQQMRQQARRQSFNDKVKQRVRRSNMSSTRSRSSGSRGGK